MKRRLMLGILCIALTLTGCTDPTSAGSATDSNATLNVYLYQKPKLFSPLAPPNGPDQLVMQMIFDSLVTVNDKYQYEPRLAESWDAAADGKTYTFHLRKGLTWSDGSPFTADDVVFTYTLLADPKSGSAHASKFTDVQGVAEYTAGTADRISGFSAPDAQTFQVTLTKPNAAFLSVITGPTTYILPKHILGSVPVAEVEDNSFFNSPTVGLGPYTFVQYRTDQYVELAANPHYRKPVQIKKIFLKPVTSDVATAQLGTGEMDLVQISPPDLPTVNAMKNVQVDSTPGVGFVRLAINQKQSRFADPRVRQAMMYALDRKTFVDKSLAGKATIPNSGFIGSQFLPTDLNPYSYDPAKARQLLQDAGWDSSKPVTLSWIPGQRDRDEAATLVQSQLSAVGMKVELKQVQAAQNAQDNAAATFDLTMFGGGNYVVDGSSVTVLIGCGSAPPQGNNLSRFCDPQIDQLLGQAITETDQAKRTALYQQVARRDNSLVSYLWLYDPETIWAYNTRLKGFKANGDFTLGFWNADEWSVGK